jgi:Rab9 effector protein with kelch motifs
MTAMNDVWALDVSRADEMVWEEVKTHGRAPSGRGYHSANLIGDVMVVVGGSDGNNVFSDIWLLDLGTRIWTMVEHGVKDDPEQLRKRIAHTSTQVGSFLFIAGGFDHKSYCSDLLVFDLSAFGCVLL